MSTATILARSPYVALAAAMAPLTTREDGPPVAPSCWSQNVLHQCRLPQGHEGEHRCFSKGCDCTWTVPKAKAEPVTDADLCWFERDYR